MILLHLNFAKQATIFFRGFPNAAGGKNRSIDIIIHAPTHPFISSLHSRPHAHRQAGGFVGLDYGVIHAERVGAL